MERTWIVCTYIYVDLDVYYVYSHDGKLNYVINLNPDASCLVQAKRNNGSFTHLEEVDLEGAVAEMQHDGALGAKPVAEVRQAGELVPVAGCYVGARFQQVFAHVVPEIPQECDLK